MARWIGLGAALALCMMVAAPASAAISGVAGSSMLEVDPKPADATIGNPLTSSDTDLLLWYESSGVLPVPIATDHNGTPGVYEGAPVIPGLVAAGTGYRSYMVHGDLLSSLAPGDSVEIIEVVTFKNPILGLVFTNEGAFKKLNASDILTTTPLAASDTAHTTGSGRQLEYGPNDSFAISPDRLTLFVRMNLGGASGDEIRVITAVPEPASLAIWSVIGLAGVGMVWRRKSR